MIMNFSNSHCDGSIAPDTSVNMGSSTFHSEGGEKATPKYQFSSQNQDVIMHSNYQFVMKRQCFDHISDFNHKKINSLNDKISTINADFDAAKPRIWARRGLAKNFPAKLHELLSRVDNDGISDIISWEPHGRSFAIHKPKKFVEEVMPRYFKQTKLSSFQRQLNLYDFLRLATGGGYYHESFLRGRPDLCKRITRRPIKGLNKKQNMFVVEPNFYAMETCKGENRQSCDEDTMGSSFIEFLERWEASFCLQETFLLPKTIGDLGIIEPTPIKEPTNLHPSSAK